MPWKEVSVVNLRKEFIDLARSSKNFSRLCENFEISRKTGYKWIERFESSGQSGLKVLPMSPNGCNPCVRSKHPLHKGGTSRTKYGT
jgi:Helix-turn-helix domain